MPTQYRNCAKVAGQPQFASPYAYHMPPKKQPCATEFREQSMNEYRNMPAAGQDTHAYPAHGSVKLGGVKNSGGEKKPGGVKKLGGPKKLGGEKTP